MEQLINKPFIEEICKNEIKDFLLELVQKELDGIPKEKFCRRKELCEAILQANNPTGIRANIRDSAMEIIKSWKMKPDQIIGLESLGFTVTKGRTHFKIRCQNSAYFQALSATPSDNRSGINCAFDFKGTFF